MIGIVYAAATAVSHVGARVKELVYNNQAKVDPKTNTYTDYHGKLRDATTGKQYIYMIEQNGDHVLYDTQHKVVRNITAEDRQNEWVSKRNDPNRNKMMETAINTHETRTVKCINPGTGRQETIKGIIYKDLENGAEYFHVWQYVDSRFHKNYHAPFEKKYFFVSVVNPYDLIRVSDRQKEIDKDYKDKGKYNWMEHPEDAERFIKDYNSRPFKEDSMHDEKHIKKLNIMGS